VVAIDGKTARRSSSARTGTRACNDRRPGLRAAPGARLVAGHRPVAIAARPELPDGKDPVLLDLAAAT
jgi:hypothetical protein